MNFHSPSGTFREGSLRSLLLISSLSSHVSHGRFALPAASITLTSADEYYPFPSVSPRYSVMLSGIPLIQTKRPSTHLEKADLASSDLKIRPRNFSFPKFERIIKKFASFVNTSFILRYSDLICIENLKQIGMLPLSNRLYSSIILMISLSV